MDLKKNISNNYFNENNNWIEFLYENICKEWNFDPCIQYLETTKFIILFSSKGGSTLIQKIIDDYPSINDSDNQKNNCFSNYQPFEENISSELYNILQGKSKKDLIIVTRNPLYKFMSGVIQDINNELHKSIITTSYASKLYNGNFLSTLISNERRLDRGDITIDSIDDDFIDAITKFTAEYIKSCLNIEGTLDRAHSAMYNEKFFNLITLNKNINLSKLIIVNIDDSDTNLINIFNSYYPEINLGNKKDDFWTHRQKWYLYFNKIFQNNDGEHFEILESITKLVSRDMFYFKILNTEYKDNIKIFK